MKKILQPNLWILAIAVFFVSHTTFAAEQGDVFDLDLSSLMEMQITSAGRKEQNLADVAAAVYVIDSHDIKNSSATSLPELLRMVPGLQVARIGASKWAVTSRGFAGAFSSELLVQIDGRTVYTPSFSGVYWDMQTVMLEEIDRIEIIRGPGATLWGANAVNGIINIITKSASDSIGLYAQTGGGNFEQRFGSIRYGSQLAENTYGKAYFEYHQRDSYKFNADSYPADSATYSYTHSVLAAENNASDDWDMLNGGFRLDGDVNLENNWTFQGDIYSGEEHQKIYPYYTENSVLPALQDDNSKVRGYNLLGRWQHKNSKQNEWTLQTYYDFTERNEVFAKQTYKTLDIDFQHRFNLLNANDLLWGLGYRLVKDQYRSSDLVVMDPAKQTMKTYNFFAQDDITIVKDKVILSLGSKFEYNDFTNFEIQPSARLLWKATTNQSLWTSVSRAIRTPSRFENDITVIMSKTPLPPDYTTVATAYVTGAHNLDSEKVISYEAGYRYAKDNSFSTDIAIFYSQYNDVREYLYSDTGAQIVNGGKGKSYGVEMSLQYAPVKWLETQLNYTFIDIDIKTDSPSNQLFVNNAVVLSNSSPKHQVSLTTGISLPKNIKLNLFGRYVDDLNYSSQSAISSIDAYFALDANIIWAITDKLEFKLAGQNLTDPDHLEFVSEYFTPPTEIGRSIYGQLSYNY